MLLEQLFGGVTEHLVLQHLDRRLSLARRGDQEALEEFLALVVG
jgi:hypothetical protein